jgi:hypothetical protein
MTMTTTILMTPDHRRQTMSSLLSRRIKNSGESVYPPIFVFSADCFTPFPLPSPPLPPHLLILRRFEGGGGGVGKRAPRGKRRGAGGGNNLSLTRGYYRFEKRTRDIRGKKRRAPLIRRRARMSLADHMLFFTGSSINSHL